jgi:hypothetical protein
VKKIQFYSIGKSFGEHSKGRELRQIVRTDGGDRSLGERLWKVGDQSYAVLKLALEQENTHLKEIDANIDDVIDLLIDQADDFFCSEFFPTLLEMVDQEMIELANGDKAKLIDVWPKYQMHERFLLFSQFIDGNPLAFKEASDFVPFTGRLAAISVLALIDEIVLCNLCGDQEGLLKCSMELEKCRAFLEAPTGLFLAMDIAVKKAASEKAKEGGFAKNALHRKAKIFVQSEWMKHKQSYQNNKSAFARDYTRRVKNEHGADVTEKTIREVWLIDTPSAGKQAG